MGEDKLKEIRERWPRDEDALRHRYVLKPMSEAVTQASQGVAFLLQQVEELEKQLQEQLAAKDSPP